MFYTIVTTKALISDDQLQAMDIRELSATLQKGLLVVTGDSPRPITDAELKALLSVDQLAELARLAEGRG